jgi:callose synthase
LFYPARYPSLRVAYIDEVEPPSKDKSKKIDKVYYSCLVKATVSAKPDDSADPVQNLDQVKQNLPSNV